MNNNVVTALVPEKIARTITVSSGEAVWSVQLSEEIIHAMKKHFNVEDVSDELAREYVIRAISSALDKL